MENATDTTFEQRVQDQLANGQTLLDLENQAIGVKELEQLREIECFTQVQKLYLGNNELTDDTLIPLEKLGGICILCI